MNTPKPKQLNAIKFTGTQKVLKTDIKKPKREKIIAHRPKYIHDFFSQEQLLKEAPQTEIYNKKSLVKLILINHLHYIM